MRACFWGVVVAAGAGRESRDEDEVSSEVDSVVEEPALAAAFAGTRPLGGGRDAGRVRMVIFCVGAPLFGVEG